MLFKILLLALALQDLSEADNKITSKLSKLTQNGPIWKFIILSENKCHFVSCSDCNNSNLNIDQNVNSRIIDNMYVS